MVASAFHIEVLYVVLPADQVSEMKDAPIAYTEVNKDTNKQQQQQQQTKSNNNNNKNKTTNNNNDTHVRHTKNYQTVTLINKLVHLSILSFSHPSMYLYTQRRERDRERQRQSERERQTDTDRQTDRQTERDIYILHTYIYRRTRKRK